MSSMISNQELQLLKGSRVNRHADHSVHTDCIKVIHFSARANAAGDNYLLLRESGQFSCYRHGKTGHGAFCIDMSVKKSAAILIESADHIFRIDIRALLP